MTNKFAALIVLFTIAFTACSKKHSNPVSPATPSSSAGTPGSGGTQNQPGVITAGEWNDLDNWSFWEAIRNKGSFASKPAYWSIYNTNRISVNIVGTDSQPVINATVELQRDGSTIFTAKTDNKGNAELWADLYQLNENIEVSKLSVVVNGGAHTLNNVKLYKDGINKVTMTPAAANNRIEVAFVVDATGSMGDELKYLKTELLDVITRVKSNNPNATVTTSSVFYRDKGDSYVTRISNFTENVGTTLNFIKDQSAGGGGDFPEAVHSALDKALNELQWSANAKTRLLFLLLDAPPHHENPVIGDLQKSMSKAAATGVKIIPVTASGIDKETESLMRFMSMTTNGTYVFITDHSGVGNDHLEATVGEYQVEMLNNLMVRLINKNAE